MSDKDKSSKGLLPVGHPGDPDLEAMSESELDARKAVVGKLRDLNEKAEQGDREAARGIRKLLNENPDLAWHFVDNPGVHAESALIDRITRDDDLTTKEFFKHQLQSMKTEIAGENPSPLERLLAERVVATWLQVQLFESFYVLGMKNESMRQGDYRQKRLDRAHRRHLSAIRTLAQIRKMGPVVQINIAEKQVNTTG